jgi:hypothetical protein
MQPVTTNVATSLQRVRRVAAGVPAARCRKLADDAVVAPDQITEMPMHPPRIHAAIVVLTADRPSIGTGLIIDSHG